MRASRSRRANEPIGASERDSQLVQQLRAGDEAAFVAMIDRYQTPMVRLARSFVASEAVAEEVVQDTWVGVIRGIDRFEGRASLQTWLYRILVNRARTTGVRESRTTLSLDAGPTVDPGRFGADDQWAAPLPHWSDEVDERLSAGKLAARVRDEIDALPPAQRQVVTLRDVDGLSSTDVCDVLGITEGNQRVLLHRARAKVRAVLEAEIGRE